MTVRRCGCPCKAPLVGRRATAKYIDHRHAQRAYRRRVKESLRAAGLPTTLSLATAETPVPTNGNNGDGPKRRARAQRRPELRVSYRKAVEVLTEAFAPDPPAGFWLTQEAIEKELRLALPPRARTQLEHEQQERKAA